MNRKICVITGGRAEYGLLRWVMQGIRDDPVLDLQLVVTGMHLSPAFGSTYIDIERDGFQIDAKVPVLTELDTPVGVARSMGLGLAGFAQTFADLKPDVIVVLGDRYEIFSAVAAALVARIPVAHLHGGELTEGLLTMRCATRLPKCRTCTLSLRSPIGNGSSSWGKRRKTCFLSVA